MPNTDLFESGEGYYRDRFGDLVRLDARGNITRYLIHGVYEATSEDLERTQPFTLMPTRSRDTTPIYFQTLHTVLGFATR